MRDTKRMMQLISRLSATDNENDPFFALTGESSWNACIGVQGNADNYVDGYIRAAVELAEAVIERT